MPIARAGGGYGPPAAPASTPAWLLGAAVNEWVEITGTSGFGGAAGDAYSGFTVSTSGDVYMAAAGGHNDSGDNRVVRLRLSDAAPSWSLLEASTASPTPDDADGYYADGLPISRHLYHTIHYVPSLDRVFLAGCRFGYGPNTPTFGNVDAYHVGGSAWAAAGTYTSSPDTSFGQVFDGSAIWTQTLRKYVPSTNTWSNPISSRASVTPRYPWAYDSARSQLFGLCYRDGEGFGTVETRASKVPVGGTTETAVTINSSSAYTQWLADTPEYAGMDYDSANDCFLFYDGRGARVVRVYKITPNSGSAWDMSLLTTTGAGPGDSPANGSGIVGRFKYVSGLGGFVCAPQSSSNLFFLRTA